MHLHFEVAVCVFVSMLNDPPEKHCGVRFVLTALGYEEPPQSFIFTMPMSGA